MSFLATLRANIAAALLGLLAACLLVITVVLTVKLHGFLWIDGAYDKIDRLTIDNNELRFGLREAERLNAEQVGRIKADQEKVNAKISSDYQRDLARLRAEFVRSKAAQGNSAGSKAGSVPDATGGVDAENVCVPRSLILQAQELELGRNALIDWVNEQMGVDR